MAAFSDLPAPALTPLLTWGATGERTTGAEGDSSKFKVMLEVMSNLNGKDFISILPKEIGVGRNRYGRYT